MICSKDEQAQISFAASMKDLSLLRDHKIITLILHITLFCVAMSCRNDYSVLFLWFSSIHENAWFGFQREFRSCQKLARFFLFVGLGVQSSTPFAACGTKTNMKLMHCISGILGWMCHWCAIGARAQESGADARTRRGKAGSSRGYGVRSQGIWG